MYFRNNRQDLLFFPDTVTDPSTERDYSFFFHSSYDPSKSSLLECQTLLTLHCSLLYSVSPSQKRQSTHSYSQPSKGAQQSCQIKSWVPPGSDTSGRWQSSCANVCFSISHCPPVLSVVLKYLPIFTTEVKITHSSSQSEDDIVCL